MAKIYVIEKRLADGWFIDDEFLTDVGLFRFYAEGYNFLDRTGYTDRTHYRIAQYTRTEDKS